MSNQYLYHQIYENILNDITSGVYKSGDKLLTEKELSTKYNVSRITSQKAMNLLVEKNIIDRFPGLGSFVSNNFTEILETEKHTNNIIGLVLESIWPSYGIEVFNAAYKKSAELGYHLVLKKSYGNQELELEAINELISMGAKGILLMPAHGDYYSEDILKLVVDKFPIVLIDRYLNGIHVPYVGSNNIKGISDAFSYLKQLGHQDIGFISTATDQATTIEERKQGYIKSCIEYKSPIYIYDNVECIIPSKYNQKNNENLIKDVENYLKENPQITAFITSEHFLAKLLKIAIRNIQKKVPEDISIICFDSPLDYFDSYEFTHIHQDETQIGEIAISYLHKCINSENLTNEKSFLDTFLIEGESTSKVL